MTGLRLIRTAVRPQSLKSIAASLFLVAVFGWRFPCSNGALEDGWYQGTYIRHADAVMMLQTGGKGLSQRENLWRLTAPATQYCPKDIGASAPDVTFSPQPIAWTNIQILRSALGSDGNLWKLLPDNMEVDVTPKVPGVDYFGFGVNTQEYTLTITANGKDLSVTNPEFCVGQKVSLQATWNPSLPSGTQTSYDWFASLDYLNSWIPPVTSDGSEFPHISPSISTNNPMPAWWYSNGNKHVFCATTNQFSNGQIVTLTLLGDISMYRPDIVDFIDGPPSYATNCVDSDHTLYLQLGDCNGHGEMKFQVALLSKYAGRTDYTQLIKRSAANGFQTDTTSGDFWLDTSLFYLTRSFNPDVPFQVRPNRVNHRLQFSDNPGFQDEWSVFNYTTSIVDTFEDYVMFRPNAGNPDANIYVCLGKTTWSWSAWTTYSVWGGWSVPSFSITRPSWPDDSNDFPTWLHIYHYP